MNLVPLRLAITAVLLGLAAAGLSVARAADESAAAPTEAAPQDTAGRRSGSPADAPQASNSRSPSSGRAASRPSAVSSGRAMPAQSSVGEAVPAAAGASPQAPPGASSGETRTTPPAGAEPPAEEILTDAWLPRFRRIFFYESHAPRLVPPNFWPVSLDDLEAALRREATPGQPGEERPQLVSAVYVARFAEGALVSDSDTSMLDLTYRDDAPGQLSLGHMNLAVEGELAPAGASAQSPRLVTLADGTVRAIVYQDCRLRFGWSRRGMLGPDGSYAFDLRIPPCGRTRFVVGMPAGARLESLDGVLTAHPSPPPEARGSVGETELSWYSIEAGGLNRLRLVARPGDAAETPQRLAVRRLGLDYTAAPDGLDWTARVVVDVPRGQAIPQLSILDGGRIASVRVNDQEVRWKETADKAAPAAVAGATASEPSPPSPQPNASQPGISQPGTAERDATEPSEQQADQPLDDPEELGPASRTRLQIVAPPSSATLAALPVSIEITGVAPLWASPADRQGTLRLPQIRFLDRQPRLALAQTDALLRVESPLRLVSFGSGEEWRIEALSGAASPEAEQVFRITGPPASSLPTVRLASTEHWPETNAALRLAVFPGELRARWEAAIQLDGGNPQPLQFQFQPGWKIDSVLLGSSSRIIELTGMTGDGRPLTVWPEADDVVDGVLKIQVTGRSTVERQGDLMTVPATWFTRLRGAVLRSVAAVAIPPTSDFDWVAGTALEGRRLKTDDLSAAVAEMIGPVDGDTLLFDTDDGLTPELQVRQPPPVFSADLHLDLRLEEGHIVEHLRVACRLPAGRLPRLRIRLGASGHRPPMQWSLASPAANRGATEEPFRAERVEGEPGEGETWELSPPGAVRDEWVIIGRRRYPLQVSRPPAAPGETPADSLAAATDPTSAAAAEQPQVAAADAADEPSRPTGQIQIPLPTIPLSQAAQTSSQRATVSVGPQLNLIRTDGPVLRIPNPPGPRVLTARTAAASGSELTDAAGLSPADRAAHRKLTSSLVSSRPAEVPAPAADGWLLRYDATSESSVVLRMETAAASPAVVWDERIEVLSGIGGGDTIRAAYRIDGPQPLELRFDPALVVTEIEGIRSPDGPAATPGRLRIAPDEAGGWVRVGFWRPPRDTRLVREFRAPLIEPAAVVLRRSWKLWAAPDTLALAASSIAPAPPWMAGQDTEVVTHIGPGETVWLVRSGFAWAAGGAISLLVLGLSWWLLRVQPWTVIAPFIGVAAAAALTPVWTSAIVGFVLLPMAAAGLLASVWGGAAWRGEGSEIRERSGRTASRSQPRQGQAAAGPSAAAPDATASLAQGSSRFGALWLVFAVTAAAAVHAAEGQPAPRVASSFPVLIPVTPDGAFSGDKVYVPKSLYDTLFRPTGGQQDLGEVQFQSASYQVRVTPSADSRVPDSVVIEATWRVEIETAAQQVRLPIDPLTLDRLEVVVDSVPNEIRPRPDGDSILVRPPRAGLNVLRASLSPDVMITAAGGVCRFEMGIPAVARASLSVASDSPLAGVSLPNCFGRSEESDSGNRLTASLGPVSDLVLLWQHSGGAVLRGAEEVQRRWWVRAGAEHVSRELELAIGDVTSAGATVELSGNGDLEPVVTSPDWMLQEGDAGAMPRSGLRLVSMVESPGPIRLLWSEPQSLSGGGTLVLPDIRPQGLLGGIDTLVAVEVPEGWAVAPPAPTSTVSPAAAAASTAVNLRLEAADFFAVWKGFRGEADSVRQFSTAAELSVQILPPPQRPARANESHHIVVTADHLRVSYLALVHSTGDAAEPLRLLLPPEMRLERLQINGRPAPAVVVPPTDRVLELLLPQSGAGEPIELGVVGTLPVDADQHFAPPRLRLVGAQIEDSRYRMFREGQLRVSEVEPPPEIAEPGAPIDYDLTAGTIPLQSWVLSPGDSSTATRLGGRYKIRDLASRFSATTLTTLRWEDGLWTMETTIDVPDFGRSTDFLTVEVPTRWVEGLNVEPAAKWSSQPATDPASQLVRILPQNIPAEAPNDSSPAAAGRGSHVRVRITSTLENAGEGGISVPNIRLLGAGRRDRYFASPRRLTNTRIDWQTRNARRATPPPSIREIAPPATSHLFYEVTGESFSATLRQADSAADAARCTLLDVALFPHDADSVLSLMRWDLLPGNRDQIEFMIPPGAQVLGTWSSGTPTAARSDVPHRLVTVPVGLSRLAQQIVLLVSLPVAADAEQLAVPRLVGIPVAKTWVSSYDNPRDLLWTEDRVATPEADASSGIAELSLHRLLEAERLLAAPAVAPKPWQPADAADYRRDLASAMMDALDASIDNVAERPTTEKRQWLRPWFARLHELGWAGLPVATTLEPAAAENADQAAEDSATAESQSETASAWAAIDGWAPRFLQRVLGGEYDPELTAEGPADATWWIPPPTWSPSVSITAPGGAETIPASVAPRETVEGDPEVRSIRVLWLGMLVWLIAGICLRLAGANYLMRPAIWLGIFGLLSTVIVPLPVSLALCSVALASPLLGRR